MRSWLLLPLAAVVAVPTHLLVRAAPFAPAAHPLAGRSPRLERITRSVSDLQESSTALAERIGARLLTPRDSAPGSVSGAEVERAARGWLEARADAAPGATAEPVPKAPSLAQNMSLEAIRSFLEERDPFDTESQLLFEELRQADRMAELVEAARIRALDHPDDPEAHLSLGMACLQSLFGAPPTAETGMLAMQADAAFDQALELDPRHLDARWAKAVALANWPTFMGKTGEAIEHFEILVRQISEPGADSGFPQAYTFLGSLYERIGERERALETWRSGLARFPGDEELARQVELAEETSGEQ